MAKMPFLKSLLDRKLFWMSLGSALSVAAILSAQALVVGAPTKIEQAKTKSHALDDANLVPHREDQGRKTSDPPEVMVIDVYNTSDKNREKVIAVVGSCLGKLQVDHTWSHRWDVVIPTKDLTKADYECLLRRGSDLKEIVPRDEVVASSTSMIVQKPDMYITDQR